MFGLGGVSLKVGFGVSKVQHISIKPHTRAHTHSYTCDRLMVVDQM